MDTPAPATAAAEAPAPAPPPPVTAVVNARFCAPEATAFALTKTISYTGRDFTITDAAGAAVMQVEAAVFALLKRSLLLDAARRPVLTMQDSGYLMGTRWAVFRGDSTSPRNLLFRVVKSSAIQIRTKIYVFLASNAGEEAPDFVIRSSYYDGACTVSPGNSDAAIAQITRRNSAQLLGFGRNKYTARINPGIDQAFILALTVILDEMH
ncbi:hypothetical protein SEVIR_9G036700v4 [Setaria viridis]|uniref:Uncharacterized protein n=1 Tax=Setaria viridis TaxID=4556 RepID=A0A4U6SR27_SETVI|nr:protein LURP-one-related 15-like [Setaria viridis]TKV90554.1 hypothetical protein SEVIR_9G036700v2 [Setaria viridis]